MATLSIKTVAFVGLACAYGLSVVFLIGLVRVMEGPVAGEIEHVYGFGDYRRFRYSVLDWKIAIPFVHREIELESPPVSFHRFDSLE